MTTPANLIAIRKQIRTALKAAGISKCDTYTYHLKSTGQMRYKLYGCVLSKQTPAARKVLTKLGFQKLAASPNYLSRESCVLYFGPDFDVTSRLGQEIATPAPKAKPATRKVAKAKLTKAKVKAPALTFDDMYTQVSKAEDLIDAVLTEMHQSVGRPNATDRYAEMLDLDECYRMFEPVLQAQTKQRYAKLQKLMQKQADILAKNVRLTDAQVIEAANACDVVFALIERNAEVYVNKFHHKVETFKRHAALTALADSISTHFNVNMHGDRVYEYFAAYNA